VKIVALESQKYEIRKAATSNLSMDASRPLKEKNISGSVKIVALESQKNENSKII
jgi:hypothetical protein